MMSRAFKISARANASLNSGTNIDIEDEAAQHAPYDATCRPDGLITLAGATQSLGEDMLKDRMDEFSHAYPLKQGETGGSAAAQRLGWACILPALTNTLQLPSTALSLDPEVSNFTGNFPQVRVAH